MVKGPGCPLLVAGLRVEDTESHQQLHVGEAHVPALPLAEHDAVAELGQRFVDTAFERNNDGTAPDPLGFEERHLSGRGRDAVRGCIKCSPGEPDAILDGCLVDLHQQRAETQRRQRSVCLTQSACPGANLECRPVVAAAVDGSLRERHRSAQEPLAWSCWRMHGIMLDDVNQGAKRTSRLHVRLRRPRLPAGSSARHRSTCHRQSWQHGGPGIVRGLGQSHFTKGARNVQRVEHEGRGTRSRSGVMMSRRDSAGGASRDQALDA